MVHAKGDLWAGVDVDGEGGVADNMKRFVWEPALVKINAIEGATEAACLVLSVDETVRNPRSEQAQGAGAQMNQQQMQAAMRGRGGRGRGGMRGRGR